VVNSQKRTDGVSGTSYRAARIASRTDFTNRLRTADLQYVDTEARTKNSSISTPVRCVERRAAPTGVPL